MNIDFINLKIIEGVSGSLVSLEEGGCIPFKIKRVYYIFNNEKNIRRGFHAHKNLVQVLTCIKGSCKILLDDGVEKKEIELSSPSKGIIIKDFVWREMFDFSSDCVLMVLADNLYDENDYIRNYDEFLNIVKVKNNIQKK